MALTPLVLYPGSKNHYSPAKERGGQAHQKESENVSNLAHVQS
jgi:hypothetical protein